MTMWKECEDKLDQAREAVKAHPDNRKGSPFSKPQKVLHFLEALEQSGFQALCRNFKGIPIEKLAFELIKRCGTSQSKSTKLIKQYVENQEELHLHDETIYTVQYIEANDVEFSP
jgi:hypothetical protein